MVDAQWKTLREASGPSGCNHSSSVLVVPGGRIYRTIVASYSGGAHVSQTFVPDPPK
ncbi:hypothetical protein BAJUN_00660 [Bajunvirus bajun]|uniref:Uncharacterized protein n=1 Tax=Brevundimonas phage vB_BgoS-Bajun TaxID=2948594 RepID=A0A9E7N4E6_9CAUD|nr:hypothetical protein BAJUN_00660 [Brevundimonas phage vB_BgoS-Bajun]